jgi:hypothetical protein
MKEGMKKGRTGGRKAGEGRRDCEERKGYEGRKGIKEGRISSKEGHNGGGGRRKDIKGGTCYTGSAIKIILPRAVRACLQIPGWRPRRMRVPFSFDPLTAARETDWSGFATFGPFQ